MNWPTHPDAEVECLVRLLDRGGWMPHEVTHIERAIRDRRAYIEGGLSSPFARRWTERLQRELDNRLRLRWDFKNGWTLDRFAQGMWQVAGVFGFNYIRPFLIDYLRERDMQRWESPEAYMKHKREQALKIRMANEYANTQKLLGVIDKMSDKQVKEFITVEKAMQTGERITLHGASHRMITRMAKASKNSPAPPTRSINPGGHPFRLVRKRR
jgi:hypothetical protein